MNLNNEFGKLENAGYDFAVAIATEQEVQNGAACGQLAMIAQVL
jgi:hypothetical protein